MVKQKTASYNQAVELITAYIQFLEEKTDMRAVLDVARRYCSDAFDASRNLKCPNSSNLPNNLAEVCRKVIDEINKKNEQIARQLLAR